MTGTNGECLCKGGYKYTNGACEACGANEYNPTPGSTECKKCPTDATVGNDMTTCTCPTDKGLFNDKCIDCKGDGYSINTTNNNCTCTEGYTQDNTTGACSKSGSSSASPLAILIICSLIISIIASIATAAVMIRRKATNARAAEAIVSDAL